MKLSLAVCLLVPGLLLAQTNPAIGTWELNVAKSTYTPGPAPKSVTRTIEVQGAGTKTSFDGVAADGSHFAYGYTTNNDGKDSPIAGTGQTLGADTVAVKRINSNTFERTQKGAGKAVGTSRTVISKDGKAMTVTIKGTNAKGEAVNNVTAWEKQ